MRTLFVFVLVILVIFSGCGEVETEEVETPDKLNNPGDVILRAVSHVVLNPNALEVSWFQNSELSRYNQIEVFLENTYEDPYGGGTNITIILDTLIQIKDADRNKKNFFYFFVSKLNLNGFTKYEEDLSLNVCVTSFLDVGHYTSSIFSESLQIK